MIKAIVSSLLVIFGVYLFFTMIASIDFNGMSFSDIKLIISICAGVVVAVFNAARGVRLIYSALLGFFVGVVLYALILWFIQCVF